MRLIAQRRLLIVDDGAATRTALENLVEPFGFEVEKAESGAIAIQLLKSHHLDPVFLDLQMPVRDGTTFLRVRRQLGETPPVVLITSSGDTRKLAESIKLGASECIPKPFEQDGIRRVIARVLAVDPSAVKGEAPRCLAVDADPAVTAAVREALPSHVEVDGATVEEAEERMGRCAYRVVLLDASSGRDAAEALCRRLLEIQAEPAFLAMGETADPLRTQPSGPFDASFSPPPRPEDMRALYTSCARPLVFFERGRINLAPFASGAATEPFHFRIASRRLRSVSSAAARMTMRLVVDLSRAPARSSSVESVVREVVRVATDVNVRPEIIVTPVLRAPLERIGLSARIVTLAEASPVAPA
jgi:CheY-like chemotaxis protein